ncbi:virulence protein [Bradyrhizobium macuxiense]|uniref:Virulence protein n=1 Tax=Bradyrhizobium macuxiense TaxID=1755647 RepID=A0A120FPW7_9BRAD|nr:VOC family protein [Bradyrhizobium macuxiense]KWV57632.1 virulence protein [Bradyrhizobium macuxiense]
MAFELDRIDHVVLNCTDPDRTVAWYRKVLGMRTESYGDGRTALVFGQQKFNVRRTGAANWKTCAADAPGSLDLCFITTSPPDQVLDHFRHCEVRDISGPVTRSGALGPIVSVYCSDPDGNLIEVASYAAA